MEIKVYNKRGKKNYKEVRLVNELKAELENRLKNDDSLVHKFKPADSFEELQQLHSQYLSKEVPFEEVKEKTSNLDSMAKEKDEEVNFLKGNKDYFNDMDDDSTFIDPFNRQEPTTYDYTNEGGFSKDSTPKNTGQTDFAEPLSFDEAFELPEEGEDAEPVENNGQQKQKEQKQREPKQKQQKEDPWNPSFDDMSGGNQKKSTKKFAKYIVEAVCALAEKGFVWYANKDISDAKLAEYELSNEMDLSILVTLENGQEATVKRFFQNQCVAAEQLSKFEEEEKKDMSEALSAVLLEKGVAPTPTQELLIVVGGVLVKKGAMLLSLKAQTNSLLDQLRSMNSNQGQYAQNNEPQQQYQPPVNEVNPQTNNMSSVSFEEAGLTSDEEMLDIERVIETRE
jgi:hypothetical protein